jgi:DNA primase
MVMDPSLFRETEGLTPEEFSAPLLGRVFSILRERHENGRSTLLAALAGDLTAEEMNHMVRVVDQPEDRANSRSALRDYIEIIRTEAVKRRVADQTDPLLAAREKYREKKAYGG